MLSSPLNAGMARVAAGQRDLAAVLDHALVSKAFPYAFYFAPKCACTTLKTMLWRAELSAGGACGAPANFADVHIEQDGPHSPWVRRQDALLPRISEGGENLFWFLFVRNPYARAYSAYNWLVAEGAAETRAGYLSRLGWLGRKPPSFEAFLELVGSQDETEMDHHWAPITSFTPLADLSFDFVGSIERLNDDMPQVMQRIFGTSKHFDPSIHMYRSASGAWEETLGRISQNALAMMRDIYRADFDAFGYSEDPGHLEADQGRLAALVGGGGVSDGFRTAARIHVARNNGPDASALALISQRIPQADASALKGLVLRNAEMPEWWAAGASQLWTLPGSPLPHVEAHAGRAPPTHALVVLASNPQPSLVLWGDAPTVVVGPYLPAPTALFICQGGSAIYLGPRTATAGNAVVDARNGATVFVAGDQLWFPYVRISTDGLHAIRDRSTGERLNAFGSDITIGEHVWLKTAVTVYGGTVIGEDVVVEDRSIVEGSLPKHSLCSGMPARATRVNVTWTRENEP